MENKLIIKVPTLSTKRNLVESIKTLKDTKIKDYGWGYIIESIYSNKRKITRILEELGFDKEDYEIEDNTEKQEEIIENKPIKREISKMDLLKRIFGKRDSIKEELDKIDFNNDNKYDLRMLYESITYSDEEIEQLKKLIDTNADEETIYRFLVSKGEREPSDTDNTILTNREEFDDLFEELYYDNIKFKRELERRYKRLTEGRDIKIGIINPQTFNRDVERLLNEGYAVYQHPNNKKYNVIIVKY